MNNSHIIFGDKESFMFALVLFAYMNIPFHENDDGSNMVLFSNEKDFNDAFNAIYAFNEKIYPIGYADYKC